jgi:Mg2+ and Co2+ transporter CorA
MKILFILWLLIPTLITTVYAIFVGNPFANVNDIFTFIVISLLQLLLAPIWLMTMNEREV